MGPLLGAQGCIVYPYTVPLCEEPPLNTPRVVDSGKNMAQVWLNALTMNNEGNLGVPHHMDWRRRDRRHVVFMQSVCLASGFCTRVRK
jgi:hypothetical protein